MLEQIQQISPIKVLSARILSDIRGKGLTVGDRYLTADEVCREFGVGKTAATKSMRHLADQEILVSRQRSGTFIGPGIAIQKSSKIRAVCVLLPAGDPSAVHWAYQPFIAGIRRAMPEVTVQFAYIPENDAVEYVRELIDASRAAGQFAGVVSVSSPSEVYRYLAQTGAPAVVSGSLYSTDLPLASIDSDNFECGRLLTEYLINRGHKKLAALMTGGGRPGDNIFMDGIVAAISTAGDPQCKLTLRMVHNEIESLRELAKELLKGQDRPTAVITRGTYQAEAITSVAKGLGLSVPDDLQIGFDHQGESDPCIDTAVYPHVEPKLTFVEIAELMGKTIKEMNDGGPQRPQRILIPVQLHKPRT